MRTNQFNREVQTNNFPKKTIIFAISAFVLLFVLLLINPFTTVQSQEIGIVTQFGKIEGTVGEGLHVINPFITEVVKMDISTQKETVPAGAASRDLQEVSTQVTLNYRLDQTQIADIYRTFRQDYAEILIQPSIQEAVKSATAKYNAEELITKREEVKGIIFNNLKERLGSSNILVTEVLITDFQFSGAFDNAVEQKVTAEQLALKAEQDLKRVQFEADQRVAQAEAEAEAIKIQAEAITQQGGKDYVQLQAIDKWDGKLPQQFVPGSSIPFLNVN